MTAHIIPPHAPFNGDAALDEVVNELNIESDVIVTSVILGFACTRNYLGQPCRFDFEHPNQKDSEDYLDMDVDPKNISRMEELARQISEYDVLRNEAQQNRDVSYKFTGNYKKYQDLMDEYDRLKQAAELELKSLKGYDDFIKKYQKFENTLSAMTLVLDGYEAGAGKWLQDGQSPPGKEGEFITGRSGGGMISPDERATDFTVSKASTLKNALEKKGDIYQGRGAYTGLVENPLKEDDHLYPTMRVMPDATIRPWTGITNVKNWGLIRASKDSEPAGYYVNKPTYINTDQNLQNGMGALPTGAVDANNQMGYIHGMCNAIVHCSEQGPWCTPYEMATGSQTTKMASCFPCSTFMYSTGYPPSSIHLGRGESWVPPQAGHRLETGNRQADGEVVSTSCNAVVSSARLSQWNTDIYKQMKLGVQCLLSTRKFVADNYLPKVDALNTALSLDEWTAEKIQNSGGALFLDALTMHDKEESRVKRTLKPLHDTLDFMSKWSAS